MAKDFPDGLNPTIFSEELSISSIPEDEYKEFVRCLQKNRKTGLDES